MRVKRPLRLHVARALIALAVWISLARTDDCEEFKKEVDNILEERPMTRFATTVIAFLASFKAVSYFLPGLLLSVTRGWMESVVAFIIVPIAHLCVVFACGQIVGAKEGVLAFVFGVLAAISTSIYLQS